MLFLKILAIVFVVSYFINFFNKRILGKNIPFSKVAVITLVITVFIYVILSFMSYLIEGN